MFSSPAPRATPRKSLYRPPGSASRAGTATPSLASERGDKRERERERREPATPRSRIVALRGASPGASSIGGESTRTLRHDDAVDQMYWARDERCAVSSLGPLPREVQDVIRRSGRLLVGLWWVQGADSDTDLVTSRISGHADIGSGYAFVATPTACVVWNYAKVRTTSPRI
jgi:nuclear pore complex protein Nup133